MEGVQSLVHEEIHDIIEELTTTGQKNLDEDYVKKLKQRCKCSNDNVKIAYNILMSQLEKPHAEIRFSSFQVIGKLFSRSHVFRQMVISDLHILFLLTIGTDLKKYPTPLPPQTANDLKTLALTTCKEWYVHYGKFYRKLELGYEFLRDVKKVDFNSIDCLTIEQREQKRRRVEKEERLRKSKLEQVDIQIHDSYNDVMSNVHQIESCFELLMPKLTTSLDVSDNPGKIKNNSDEDDLDCLSSNQVKIDMNETKNKVGEVETGGFDGDNMHGVGKETGIQNNYRLSIGIDKTLTVLESDDNKDLIKRTRELYKELKGQYNTVKRWLQILIKCRTTDRKKIEEILSLKNLMSAKIEQFSELQIMPAKESESESDEDFVDVPEVVARDNKHGSFNRTNLLTTGENDESTTRLESDDQQPGPSLTRKEKLLQIAPVVSYGVDLQHWGKDKRTIPVSIKNDSLHRFWKPSEHEEIFVPDQIAAAMNTRKMNFLGKSEPVKRKCGAPLSSGEFCSRMDRFKCPFHGKIVERDGFGRPVNSDEAEKELKRKHEKEKSARESIQKEIDAALGTNLSSKKRKKRETPQDKSKARYARLTKLNNDQSKSSSSKRLEKKVFSNRALTKVYQNMNETIRKKNNEKFGSNFNY